MTANQYEHKLIWITNVENQNGGSDLVVTAAAADLTPGRKVTLRSMTPDEVGEDMNVFIQETRESMDELCDLMVDHVVDAKKKRGDPQVPHDGYAELVEQFQDAPHLLLCNMLASMVSLCAHEYVEAEQEAAANASQQAIEAPEAIDVEESAPVSQ